MVWPAAGGLRGDETVCGPGIFQIEFQEAILQQKEGREGNSSERPKKTVSAAGEGAERTRSLALLPSLYLLAMAS